MAWLKRVLRLIYRFSWRSPYYRSTLTLDHSPALLAQAALVFNGRLARVLRVRILTIIGGLTPLLLSGAPSQINPMTVPPDNTSTSEQQLLSQERLELAERRMHYIARAQEMISKGMIPQEVKVILGGRPKVWDGTWWSFDKPGAPDQVLVIGQMVREVIDKERDNWITYSRNTASAFREKYGEPDREEPATFWRYNMLIDPRESSAIVIFRSGRVVQVRSFYSWLE